MELGVLSELIPSSELGSVGQEESSRIRLLIVQNSFGLDGYLIDNSANVFRDEQAHPSLSSHPADPSSEDEILARGTPPLLRAALNFGGRDFVMVRCGALCAP